MEDLFGPLFVTSPIVRVLIATTDWTMIVFVHIDMGNLRMLSGGAGLHLQFLQ